MAKPATKKEFEHVIEMCNSTEKWNEVLKTDKLTEWMIDGGSDTLILKLTSTDFVGIEPEWVFDTLLDPEYRNTWDDRNMGRNTIEVINSSNYIIHYLVKVPVVTNRDYVFRQATAKFGDDYILYNSNVIHEKCPPQAKFVRGTMNISAYYIQKTENGCKVTCVSDNNLGGSLPSFLVNTQAKNILPKTMEAVKKASLKYNDWKKSHNPDSKPWRELVDPVDE